MREEHCIKMATDGSQQIQRKLDIDQNTQKKKFLLYAYYMEKCMIKWSQKCKEFTYSMHELKCKHIDIAPYK